MEAKKFTVPRELLSMHILFPFSLTKHLYLYYFLLWSDICMSLVSMWSQSGKVESSTAPSDKSGPCLNAVAAAVTVEGLGGGLPLAAFSSLHPRANQWPVFSALQCGTGEMKWGSRSSYLSNALEMRQNYTPLDRQLTPHLLLGPAQGGRTAERQCLLLV